MPFKDKTERVDFRTARAILSGRAPGLTTGASALAKIPTGDGNPGPANRKGGGPGPRPDGSGAERALYALLERIGCADAGRREWEGQPVGRAWWFRQYPWGAYLEPARKFQADAGFPLLGLLVEVEGKAHDLKRKKDVVRRQLAEAAGWRVVALLPEQLRNGEAEGILRTRIDQEVRDV